MAPTGRPSRNSENRSLAHVIISGEASRLAGGDAELDIDAGNVMKLFKALGDKYPALKPHLESGFAVAIDGELYEDAMFQSIDASSEVVLIAKIEGG